MVREVNRLLGLDLATPLSLAQVAAEMHVSVSALSHRYRREAGMAPMAAYRALRIDRAKALLLRGIPLHTIAEELGFSDAAPVQSVQAAAGTRAAPLSSRAPPGPALTVGEPDGLELSSTHLTAKFC